MKKTNIFLVVFLTFFTSIFSQSKKNHRMEPSSNHQREALGLLVLLKAKPGKEEELRKFLISAHPLVKEEPKTISWYAFRLDNQTFGIFDTFEQEEGRQAHLNGKIAEALMANAKDLLASNDLEKAIQPVEILAAQNGGKQSENIGLLVTMKAQANTKEEVEAFLKSGLDIVRQEKGTRGWYAIKIGDQGYAIFDTFDKEEGRQAHLKGEVAKALLEKAPTLLNGFTTKDIQTTSILAKK